MGEMTGLNKILIAAAVIIVVLPSRGHRPAERISKNQQEAL